MWKFKSLKGKDKWIFLLTIGVILCILAFPIENLTGRSKENSVGNNTESNTENNTDRGRSVGENRSEDTASGYLFADLQAAEETYGSDASWFGEGAAAAGSTGGNEASAAGSMGGNGAAAAGSTGGNGASAAGSTGGKELALAGSLGREEEVAAASARAGSSYEAQLEQRIRDLLKHVDGVGNVDVMVVLKSSSEKVIHVDDKTSYSSTNETDSSGGSRKIESQDRGSSTVMTSRNGQSMPIIEKEICPEVSGIIISAVGGGSPSVQAEISAAMEALFGIPAHKIKVLKRVE